MIITVTGHRPGRLGEHDPSRLVDLAAAALNKYSPSLVITGMAQGWDMAVAEACVRLGTQFVAAVPHIDQASAWPEAQYHRYWELLGHAIQPVTVVSTEIGPEAFKLRNGWMVGQLMASDDFVLSLWDGKKYGGTWHTIWYAQASDRQVVNLWPSWQKGAKRC